MLRLACGLSAAAALAWYIRRQADKKETPRTPVLVLFYDRATRLLASTCDCVSSNCRIESWRHGEPAERLEELIREADIIVSGPGLQGQAALKQAGHTVTLALTGPQTLPQALPQT